jgi:hypothetical protein
VFFSNVRPASSRNPVSEVTSGYAVVGDLEWDVTDVGNEYGSFTSKQQPSFMRQRKQSLQ